MDIKCVLGTDLFPTTFAPTWVAANQWVGLDRRETMLDCNGNGDRRREQGPKHPSRV